MCRFNVVVLFMLSILKLSLAQNDTISIDFGGNESPLFWNNVSLSTNSISGMINLKGNITTIGINIYDQFNGVNSNGPTNLNESLSIPDLASSDSFWGNTVSFSGTTEPTGGIELKGLNPEKLYAIMLLSSRMDVFDNRETKFVFAGASLDTLLINASNNTSVITKTFYSSADGTLTIDLSPGSNNNNSHGFFYLNALKLIYEEEDVISGESSLSLISPNGGEFWQVNKNPYIIWKSTYISKINIEYSTDNGSTWILSKTVPAYTQRTQWTVPSAPSLSCLVRVASGSLNDTSDDVFEISNNNDTYTIVVLGSSTAAGAGASTSDSTWVNRYRKEVTQRNTSIAVSNLAVGGYTTYHILPTGTSIPTGINITPDTQHNITKALTFDPYAIIINMPSNDAAYNYTVSQQMSNYKIISDIASSSGVQTWVCTPQPRNFGSTSQIQLQFDAVDSVQAVYGDYSIDFWSDLADENGFIFSKYNSGDGVHLNNAGHRLLFERVMAKEIELEYNSDFTNAMASLNAENQIQIYPNPANDEININAKKGSVLRLIDITGKVLQSEILQSEYCKIKLNLNSGIYIVQVIGSEQLMYSTKLIVK